MSANGTANGSPKTHRQMKQEAQSLYDGIEALKAKGEDRTPDDVRKIRDDTAALEGLLTEIKDCTYEESASKADQLYHDIKTICAPDRPDFSAGDGAPGHNGRIRGNYAERWAPATKSLGQSLVESEEFKAFNPGVMGSVGVEFGNLLTFDGATKATFTTALSTLTQYDRPPGLVTLGQQRLTVADLMPTGTTTSNTIRYAREDTYTNAATPVAEGAAKPEASWDVSEVDAVVRKIAVWSKITDEMYNDFPVIQSYIDNRMRFMVQSTEEAQLLNGSGVAPNLRGILQTVGIQTEAQGTNPPLEAIHRAITKIRSVAFFEPDGIVMHPTDYEIARLETDTNDQYYGGGPFTGAYGVNGIPTQPGPWGLRPVITTAIAAGTVLVGAFGVGAQVFRRAGVTLSMTNTDQDDFIKNLITLRCEVRLTLAVYRPLAFCSVTGFAASA